MIRVELPTLALARSREFDLLLLDLNLPEMGGLELLGRLATIAPALPVLVLSMHAEPLSVARAMESGVRGYVSKNIAPRRARHGDQADRPRAAAT
ncbi:MAG TPA: response regulator [Sphingomicrobium sp.]|nr:response regulator [Sphingomicrobium sp.]